MSLSRRQDRPRSRPEGVVAAVEDRLPLPAALGLAAQHIAIQAIYLVLPVVAATAFGLQAREAAMLACLDPGERAQLGKLLDKLATHVPEWGSASDL